MITTKIDIYRSASLMLWLETIKTGCYDRIGTSIFNLASGTETGSLENGPTFGLDGSLILDGVDDFLEFLNPNTFDPNGLSNLTVSLWVRNTNDTGGLVCWYDAAGSDNGIEMELYGGDVYIAFASADYGAYTYGIAGSWVNFSFTYDGSQATNADKLKFYVNGLPVTLSFGGTIPSVIDASTVPSLTVGLIKSGIGDRYIEGRVGHVLAYSETLTDEQVLQNFNAIRDAYSL